MHAPQVRPLRVRELLPHDLLALVDAVVERRNRDRAQTEQNRNNFLADVCSVYWSPSVSLALGASALVLDKAWEMAGILPNPQSADGRVKLRTLVYMVHMVRCADAHGLADPKWEVRGGYRQVLEVGLPGAPLTLDLRDLHGQAFDFDLLGGHARWFEIRDASVATINA